MSDQNTASATSRKLTPYEEAIAPFRSAWSTEAKEVAASLAADLDFAARLRATRQALGLTQVEVAAITGEDQGDVSRLERGLLNPTVARASRDLAALRRYAEQRGKYDPGATVSPRPLLPAAAAAEYLLTIQDEEDGISGLKLQKLLYYAQGYALALLGQPLFGAKIKAWNHGPVVPAIWHTYRQHESDAIPAPTGFDPLSINASARAILDRVYAEFGQFSAWRLREMTHAERPWKEMWDESDRTAEIPPSLMAESFAERLQQRAKASVEI